MQALLGAVQFEDGGRYLVAANDDGQVTGLRLQRAVLRRTSRRSTTRRSL